MFDTSKLITYISTKEDGNLSLYTKDENEALKNRQKLAKKLNFNLKNLRTPLIIGIAHSGH
jgi:hypothetical protein